METIKINGYFFSISEFQDYWRIYYYKSEERHRFLIPKNKCATREDVLNLLRHVQL